MGSVGQNRAGICSQAGLLLLLLSVSCAAASTPKRVLILDSFRRDVAPFDSVVSAFRTTLARDLGERVDIYEAPLDLGRFADAGSEQPFLQFLERRFEGRPLDLVVSIGGPAARFAAKHSETLSLFSGVPVLVVGVDQRIVPTRLPQSHTVHVLNNIDLPGMIDDLLCLRPKTTNVVVVMGASPHEAYWTGECRREWAQFTNRVGFSWLNNLTLPRIQEKVRNLPPHSFIFFGMLVADADQVPYDNNEALAAIHAAANAPIYGCFASQFGHGIVGGRLYREDLMGVEGAGIAIRILRGEKCSEIPDRILGASSPVYDWRELVRWGIQPDQLTAHAKVEFREPTFWQRYRKHFLALISLCALEAGLIFGLIANLTRRRRAEASLRASRERYALAAEGANDGLWDWDLGTNAVYYSPRWKSMLGYADKEVADTFSAWENLLHPDDKTRALNAIQSCLRGATSTYELEHRLRHKDGSYRWILARGKLQRDTSGQPCRMAGSHTDITASKRTEEALRGFSARLISTQEQERSRLARELHDDITQRLARLAIDVGRSESASGAATAAETARSVKEELIRLSEDVHALSYRLHPSLLEDLGLSAALKTEAERFQRQGPIPLEIKVQEVPESTSQEAALCVFRIAQEALRNSARHSGAQAIKLSLQTSDGGLQLAVEDDGCGFDPQIQHDRPSLGLASMRERVYLLGGELDIETAPGQGTTVLAWVPFSAKGT